jgi:hypothetical protein
MCVKVKFFDEASLGMGCAVRCYLETSSAGTMGQLLSLESEVSLHIRAKDSHSVLEH